MGISQIGQESTAVELSVDGVDLARRGELEDVDALDGVLVGAHARSRLPAPSDLVAAGEVAEGGDEERRLGARALDEGLLALEGDASELLGMLEDKL